MTSVYSNSRYDHNPTIRINTKEIQTKKESLKLLEATLNERISEFRELCLKEGELTGQLPNDYPLKPREPIPQIRRRVTHHLRSNSSEPLNKQYEANEFQPYYEETKPFQMSDFYKYSSKYRIKNNIDVNNQHQLSQLQQQLKQHQLSQLQQQLKQHHQALPHPPLPLPVHQSEFKTTIHQSEFKTTRQMQEDVMKKNSLKFSACDDQIQASVKLIEKSGQKLIEATAKAIAGNPGLADKLSNILPGNNIERYR